MAHTDILSKFFEMFPNYLGAVSQWSPMGSRGLKLKTNNRQSLEFIYYDDKNWSFNTINYKNRGTKL